MGGGGGVKGSLFETRRAKGRLVFKGFAASVSVAICLIWFYRLTHVPAGYSGRRWVWIGLLAAEVWFGIYWVVTQAARWNLTYRSTFKDRLSQRYEDQLPKVDVFVCTADPKIEPPLMVVNTVLSVMAYDYPTEKLSVYLSDDAGSELTFFAMLEASEFSKHWLPFCKEFKVEPRSPAAFFDSISRSGQQTQELLAIKKLYEDMKNRIEGACKLGRVPDGVRTKHEGFSQWDSYSSARDHDAVVQILIDRKESMAAADIKGRTLPTLVYMAREKRPDYFHNFKAGAMNALIRVSSRISNGDIILNVDCDMYSNNSESIRDALCFFMDETRGHEFAFVQFPQSFINVTKNDIYSSKLSVIGDVEFHGLDGYEGVMYIGSGCFHRRESLCGKEYDRNIRSTLLRRETSKDLESTTDRDLGEIKTLSSCAYEKNSPWGTEMGLKYGCPVEDVATGLSIQCKGWKAVYFNPERKAFLGIAGGTLLQTLVQHKRWSEGDLLLLLSKLSPIRSGPGRISPGLIMGYLIYCFWAPNSIPTLYYSVIPSIYLLRGISLFPQVSSPWFVPFAYVIIAKYIYSLVEFLYCGGTVLGWWNDQRMWLYKRISSYIFATIDTVTGLFGFSDPAFVITAKVTDEDVSTRFEKEVMEFGTSSPLFTVITTVALINLICLTGTAVGVAISAASIPDYSRSMFLQGLLCLLLVLINFPIYQGVLFRKDGGRMPLSTSVESLVLAVSVCTCFAFL